MSEQDIFGKLTLETAFAIRDQILEAYTSGEVDEVSILFNRYKPKLDEDPMPKFSFLPIDLPETSEDSEPLYEPSDSSVLGRLLPYYLGFKIYHYLLESESAEFLARMTAMDSASDNAADLIANLTLDFNRARQTSITREILEIVSGAEALK
jgi:F-type H+-transporting ATPase subunit gamma